MRLRTSTLFAIILFCSNIFAQSQSTVTIIDRFTLEPISNVSVQFHCETCPKENSKTTVYSNLEGKVLCPYAEPTNVSVSHVAYMEYQTSLNKNESITIELLIKNSVLDDIVITAQHKPGKAKDAIQKIKIIDRKGIENQGAVNLRDVLRNQTNIRISQDNILGSSTNIQGLSGQNVKILIDGIPVIGRQGGNVDLSQINLNNIERIEIVEGPLSVEYGTNALAGTINLISKKNPALGTEIGVNSYYESVGQYNVDGQISFRKKDTKLVFEGGRNYFDGWSPNDNFIDFPQSELADLSRVDDWKPKTQYFAQGRFATKVKGVNLNFKSSYFTEKINNKGLPRAPYYETAFDEKYNTLRFDNSFSVNSELKNNSRINMIFSKNEYNRKKSVYFNDLTTLNEQLSPNSDDQDTTYANLYIARGTYSQHFDSLDLSFSVGYDINLETGSGSRINGGEKSIDDYALFGSLEYLPTKNLKIRPGIRYTYNTSYDAPLTPSVNLQYTLKKYSLRASYSKGFRSPSIRDLYFNFVDINHNIQGNADLNAETSDNFTIGVSHEFKLKKGLFQWSSSFYYNEIENLITLAQGIGNEFTYVNLNHFETNGVQLNLQHTNNPWTLSLGGSYTGANNGLGTTDNKSAYYYSPEIRSSIAYELKNRKLTLASFYKYTGKVNSVIYVNDTDLQEIFIGDYHHLDFTATKSFWSNYVQWSVGVKNILDVKDIQASTGATIHGSNEGTTQLNWGRSLFTSLRFNFNLKNDKL